MSDAGKRLITYMMLGASLDDCREPDCRHEWLLDRPESDSCECLICGAEVLGR